MQKYTTQNTGIKSMKIFQNLLCPKFHLQNDKQQARKLQATLEGCNPKLWLTRLLVHSLTGVKCRATSVAKNIVIPFLQGEFYLIPRFGSILDSVRI